MWCDIVIQVNVELLCQCGFYLFGLVVGSQVCGDVGFGCMFEVEELVQCVVDCFQCQVLIGVYVLIIVGLIQENIDLVCYIINYSFGKMGFVFVEVVVEVGVWVILVIGLVYLFMFDWVQCVDVVSVCDMLVVCEVVMFCDLLIVFVVVVDYCLEVVVVYKLKKDFISGEGLFLQLVCNFDIFVIFVQCEDCFFSVGFVVEIENLLDYVVCKLKDKNFDLIVVNDVVNFLIGFNSDENVIMVIDCDLYLSIFVQISKGKIVCQLIVFIVDCFNQ